MLGLEAERSGHPAAGGIDQRRLEARNGPEDGEGRVHARCRPLVAVPVEERARGDRPEAPPQFRLRTKDRRHQFVDELRLSCDLTHGSAIEQVEVLVTEREDA